jgi:hypothetical protein
VSIACEIMGGPLDGMMATVSELRCACCDRTFLSIVVPPKDLTRDLAESLLRMGLAEVANGYVLDDVLKRLTWRPE